MSRLTYMNGKACWVILKIIVGDLCASSNLGISHTNKWSQTEKTAAYLSLGYGQRWSVLYIRLLVHVHDLITVKGNPFLLPQFSPLMKAAIISEDKVIRFKQVLPQIRVLSAIQQIQDLTHTHLIELRLPWLLRDRSTTRHKTNNKRIYKISIHVYQLRFKSASDDEVVETKKITKTAV